eukprot:5129488-Pyramimonas_sp.AAC.1
MLLGRLEESKRLVAHLGEGLASIWVRGQLALGEGLEVREVVADELRQLNTHTGHHALPHVRLERGVLGDRVCCADHGGIAQRRHGLRKLVCIEHRAGTFEAVVVDVQLELRQSSDGCPRHRRQSVLLPLGRPLGERLDRLVVLDRELDVEQSNATAPDGTSVQQGINVQVIHVCIEGIGVRLQAP